MGPSCEARLAYLGPGTKPGASTQLTVTRPRSPAPPLTCAAVPDQDLRPINGGRLWYKPGMFAFIVVLIVVGLIVGLIARLLLPGPDKIGILGTILLGIVGSFVGGFLQRLVEGDGIEVHHFHTVGIIGSIIGAIVVLLILRVTGMERGHRRSRTSTRRRWI